MRFRILSALSITLGMLAFAGTAAHAQVSYATINSTYSQNFDTLITSGTNQAWSNNTTLTGWFLFRQPANGTAITQYNADTGSSTTGSFVSYGSAASTERALGGLGSGGTYFGSPASGAIAGWIALGMTNNTGNVLNKITINYDGEQWRNSAAVAQTMVFEYGFATAFTGVTTWTAPGAGFNFTSPITGGSAGALNGNLAANRVAGLGGSILLSGSDTWAPGETVWFRWRETNDTGNDHGLAIDNVSVVAIPEASTVGLIGLLLPVAGMIAYRRRKAN